MTDAQAALANMREAIQGVIEPAVFLMTANEANTILAHVEAQAAEIERLRELLCQCDMRTRLVGDGCEFCNPTLADELAKEQR